MNRLILVAIFACILSTTGMAQAPNQDLTTSELQRQLDEMRRQTAQIQNRIADLEAAREIASTTGSEPYLTFSFF